MSKGFVPALGWAEVGFGDTSVGLGLREARSESNGSPEASVSGTWALLTESFFRFSIVESRLKEG